MPELALSPCQALCAWSPTTQVLDGLRLFRCGGCGSEWVRTEGWTPVDADGEVPAAVSAERAAAAARPLTGGRCVDGAGSAGSGTTSGS